MRGAFITIFIIFCVTLLSGSIFLIYKLTESKSEIWTFDRRTGNVDLATSTAETPADFDAECKHHVRLFYEYYFQYDKNNFTDHLNRSLYLVGNCGKDLRKSYKDNDILKRLQENNINVTIDIKPDSIILDYNSNPIHGIAKAVQTASFLNGDQSKRHMDISFDLIVSNPRARSIENPHGMTLENITLINDGKIE
jgi:hypothetical protein